MAATFILLAIMAYSVFNFVACVVISDFVTLRDGLRPHAVEGFKIWESSDVGLLCCHSNVTCASETRHGGAQQLILKFEDL